MKPHDHAISSSRTARTRPSVGVLAFLALTVASYQSAIAATTPSQIPLFTAVAGAQPNVMFVLDNSGSMSFEYPEGYSITSRCKIVGWTRTNCSGSETQSAWHLMRSTDANLQFYNPSVTYLPRMNVDGTPQTNPLKFVDNQSSSKFSYTAPGNIDYTYNSAYYTPDYSEYTGTVPSGKAFTYVSCLNLNCTSRTEVNLVAPVGTTPISLPAGHNRSDCGTNATTCTADKELTNVLNWYQWYRTRMLAVGTATGQAMLAFDNKFRIGYSKYTNTTPNTTYAQATNIVRGVRYFRDEPGNSWKTDFYNWLYTVVPAGGTPSHAAYNIAAKYYNKGVVSTYGNPWKNDPRSTSSESNATDLSCRRAYTIVLSDGAWSDASSGNLPGGKYASITGTNYSGTPNGNPAVLQFNPNGATGYNNASLPTRVAARNLYIPYSDGGISSNGLADLAAKYFWNTDFSSTLDNNVPPIPGQNNPTFWQNMTTFTIGWGLTPTGEMGTPGGLTWQQIDDYRTDWLTGNTTYTRPKWADGNTWVDLNAVGNDSLLRVNDFIRAGFAGGGKAYSVYSGDDVRRALNDALSSMVGSGNDAGVAVSGNSGEFQTLNGQLKYTTEYQTADNSGDIKAFKLNTNGGYAAVDGSGTPIPEWSANARMPVVNDRKIFSLSSYDADAPSAAVSLRTELNYSTSLSALPGDFVTLLNADSMQKTDQSFVRYMLGQDIGPTNISNMPYRKRSTPIGASVNSAPAFVGGRVDMDYANIGNVTGKADYAAYLTSKKTLPATIFAATNDGKVHVLNAAKTDTEVSAGGVAIRAGAEFASFMPKSAMARQIELANPAYHFSYVLDGPLTEEDVYASNPSTIPGNTSGAAWQQLVFGTGGRGGKFMYGLRSPLNTTNRIPTKNDFLWELDAGTTGYGDLAFISNKTTAGQLDDSTWVVLAVSGHYGGPGKQVGLYVIDAFTGKRKAFIPLPAAYNNTATSMANRGLGGVTAVRDTNRQIVAAYAGDANGNLWRFDLRSTKMVVSYGRPLFTTPGGAKQPIYAAPAWQAHPGNGATCAYNATTQCGAIVVVGTGILLDEDDLATPATQQAIYGIWDTTPIGGNDDPAATPVNVGDLVEQTIDLASKTAGTGTEGTGRDFYQVSTNSVDWMTKKGWLLKLGKITYAGAMLNGERVVGDLANLGSSVEISAFLPAEKSMTIESCTATSSLPNNIYLVDALTGRNKYSFDQNSDGVADFVSVVSIASGGFTRGNMTSGNAPGKVEEGRTDLKPTPDCTGEIGYYTGVGGTVKGFDACPAQSWRRSWRQVVSPPF